MARATGRAELRFSDGRPSVHLAGDLEIARSFLGRLLGLMGRRALAVGGGLWLPGANGIHMLWMRFPIDCLFLTRPDEAGWRRIVAVRPELPPWRGVVWFVRGAAGALELPAGTAARTGAAPGDEILLLEA